MYSVVNTVDVYKSGLCFQAVVVVKYLFQFGFFPWNDGSMHDSPFWPPRIIGIEKKTNYAVFDLILLVCLFMHRTVLKVSESVSVRMCINQCFRQDV